MDTANQTEYYHDDSVHFAMLMTLGITGILGNALVCLTIFRAKFMHTTTNYLVAHLAAADLLVCLAHVIFQERFISYDAKNPTVCIFFRREILVWFFIILSTMCMMIVTVERYIAIVHLLQYPRYFTSRRIRLTAIGIWLLAAGLSSLHVIMPSHDLSQRKCLNLVPSTESPVFNVGFCINLSLFIIPACCLFFCYVKIILNLRRSAEMQRRDNNHAPANELLRAQRRVALVLMIVAAVYLILWFPVVVYDTIIVLGSHDPVLYGSLNWASLMPIFNSLINPIIYAFKYKEFQRGLKEAVFPWCFKRHRRVKMINDEIALG